MVKKVNVKVTEVTPENMQEAIDHFCNLLESENTKSAIYGYRRDGKHVVVDLITGNVEITYPDGSAEKIAGTNPRAQEYWNPHGYDNDGNA